MPRVLATAALLLLALPAAADDPPPPDPPAKQSLLTTSMANRDWPMLQHDIGRTGRSGSPAIAEPVMAWRTWVGVSDYRNAPIAVGDRVYIATSGRVNTRGDDMDGLRCVGLAEGLPLWHRTVPVDGLGVAYSDGRVFFVDTRGFIHGVDARNGKLRWSKDAVETLDGDPLPLNGRLAIGASSSLSWRDQKTGRIPRARTEIQTSHPPYLASDGRRVFIAPKHRRPLSIEINDKREADPLVVDTMGFHNYGLPAIVRKHTVVYPFGMDIPFRSPQMLIVPALLNKPQYDPTDRFVAIGEEMPKQLWHLGIRHPVGVYDKWTLHVRPTRGLLTAVHHETGKISWATPIGRKMRYHTSGVIIAEHTAYLGCADGTVRAFDLKERKLVWTVNLHNDRHIRPRLPEGLLREAPDGTVWEAPSSRSVQSSMAIASDGTLLVATVGGYLYAIRDKDWPVRKNRIDRPAKDALADWRPVKVGQKLAKGTRLRLGAEASVLLDLKHELLSEPLTRYTANDEPRVLTISVSPSVVLIVEGDVRTYVGE